MIGTCSLLDKVGSDGRSHQKNLRKKTINRNVNRTLHLTVALGAVGLVALLPVLAAGAQPAVRADGDTIEGLFDINGVFAVDRSTVWVVTEGGGSYRSDDGGAHWEKQPVPSDAAGDWIQRISAVDGLTAWAVTEPDHPPEPGHVLHTADGGQTWIAQTTPVTPAWWGVPFVR